MGQQAEVISWKNENLCVGFFSFSLVVYRGSLYQHFLFLEHKNKNMVLKLRGIWRGNKD